jgi:hypothetical protein
MPSSCLSSSNLVLASNEEIASVIQYSCSTTMAVHLEFDLSIVVLIDRQINSQEEYINLFKLRN